LTRKIHIPLGIITAAGLYWTAWEGMHNEWTGMSPVMSVPPTSVQVLFWVLFTGVVGAYMLAVGQVVLNFLANSAVVYPSVGEKSSMDNKDVDS
jgi:TRAP-type C4-dicarboxylate transport system permease small subunit